MTTPQPSNQLPEESPHFNTSSWPAPRPPAPVDAEWANPHHGSPVADPGYIKGGFFGYFGPTNPDFQDGHQSCAHGRAIARAIAAEEATQRHAPTPEASAQLAAMRDRQDTFYARLAEVLPLVKGGVLVDAAKAVVAQLAAAQSEVGRLTKERDEAIKAHGFVWNAARKAAQYFRWAGCRDTIAIEAMNQCCEAEKLSPKWSTDWVIVTPLELATLRRERDQARQDLEEKCAALQSLRALTEQKP